MTEGLKTPSYQSVYTGSGNPYFIDLEKLIKKGWITKEGKKYYFGKFMDNMTKKGEIFHNKL